MNKTILVFNSINLNFIFFFKFLTLLGFKIFYYKPAKNTSFKDYQSLKKLEIYQIDVSRLKSINKEDWENFLFGKKINTNEILEKKLSLNFVKCISKNYCLEWKKKEIYYLFSDLVSQNLVNKSIILKLFFEKYSNKVFFISFDNLDIFTQTNNFIKICLPLNLPTKIIFKKFSSFISLLKKKIFEKNKNISSKNFNPNLNKKRIIYVIHHGLNHSNNRKTLLYDEEDLSKNSIPKEEILFFDYTNEKSFNSEIEIVKSNDLNLNLKQFIKFIYETIKLLTKVRNIYDAVIFTKYIAYFFSSRKFYYFLKKHPRLKIAFYDYDFLTPKSLVFTTKMLGLINISYQERPMTVYYNNIFFCYDYYFFVSNFFLKKIENKKNYSIKFPIISGFYDVNRHISSDNKNAKSNKKILFILYPESAKYNEKIEIETSNRSQKSALIDLIKCSKIFPNIDFSVINKSEVFFQNKDLSIFFNKMKNIKNIKMYENNSHNFSLKMIANHDLIIGKQSTIMDKCLYLKKPFFIHEYQHNLKKQFSDICDYLDNSFFVNSFDELVNSINFYLNNEKEFLKKIIQNSEKIFDNSSDAKKVLNKQIDEILKKN